MSNFSIWTSLDRLRWFLVPDEPPFLDGSVEIADLSDARRLVDADWLRPFEVTEEQARRWAKDQLGETLDELKSAIDGKLAEVRAELEARDRAPVVESFPMTPNAGAALLDFFKALPRIVGQGISGDDARVGQARETMADLQQQLKAAGIDVDDRLQEFPERLAGLRKTPPEPKS